MSDLTNKKMYLYEWDVWEMNKFICLNMEYMHKDINVCLCTCTYVRVHILKCWYVCVYACAYVLEKERKKNKPLCFSCFSIRKQNDCKRWINFESIAGSICKQTFTENELFIYVYVDLWIFPCLFLSSNCTCVNFQLACFL